MINLVPVTTDFWSVSRRKQVTLRGGVWKHVLSEAYWMIPWCQGGGGEYPQRTQQVQWPVAGGRPSAFWKPCLECGMDNGGGERAEAGADSFQMTTLLMDLQTGPVFYLLSPHLLSLVSRSPVFCFPLWCGQANGYYVPQRSQETKEPGKRTNSPHK